MEELKQCKSGKIFCSKWKPLSEFELRKDNGKYRNQCKECISKLNKIYRQNNKEKLKIKRKEWEEKNKEKIIEYQKDYKIKNKEILSIKAADYNSKPENKEKRKIYDLIYYNNNKERLRPIRQKRRKERWKNDINFKLRSLMTHAIWYALNINGSSKNGNSILKYLEYTIDELRAYIENQFEYWMTWDNWSKYDANTWDDNDPSTWTWQIDHIIPQSDLPYTSMEDENFKKCWAQSNIRPLNAKQNWIDGIMRVRHIKIA